MGWSRLEDHQIRDSADRELEQVRWERWLCCHCHYKSGRPLVGRLLEDSSLPSFHGPAWQCYYKSDTRQVRQRLHQDQHTPLAKSTRELWAIEVPLREPQEEDQARQLTLAPFLGSWEAERRSEDDS